MGASSPPWTITAEYGSISSVHTKPHQGIDFAVPIGTPVKSVTDGKVIKVEDTGNNGFGKSVMISSNNRTVIYAHLSKQLAEVGQEIKLGDIIGESGNTGRSTGPHLHFQVNINGKAIDPNPTLWQASLRKALLRG